MLPLYFKEYLSSFEDKTDLSRKFRDYLRYSSFPQAIELYNINPENINLFLDGIYNTILFKDVMQNDGLIITGESGVGKTHLAASIANKLIENDKIVLMGRLTMLLDMIKETFRDNTRSENELIELYSNVDMIIIDDLGTEKISQWALENCIQ